MLSLDYPSTTPKQHDIDYYVPEQCQFSYHHPTTQIPCLTANEMNAAIPIWTSVTNQSLFPLLSHPSAMMPDVPSPCYITSSPSTSTDTSLPSPNNYSTTMTPLASLQQWTRESLIDRVMTLEHELEYCRSSEPPKQEGWQCRWEACDTVTSTLEQLTDHLYRIHVGRGKASYYCGWTGCARHDKPFTKRHKALNHLRTHTVSPLLKRCHSIHFLFYFRASVHLYVVRRDVTSDSLDPTLLAHIKRPIAMSDLLSVWNVENHTFMHDHSESI
ncbi:unnamed protein product [Absidia cylindrospora]